MKLARLLHYIGHPPDGPADPYRKDKIMAHFNVDSLKSYAIAAVASLYCSMLFLAAVGPNAAHFSGLVA
jgi:hypothetical protein